MDPEEATAVVTEWLSSANPKLILALFIMCDMGALFEMLGDEAKNFYPDEFLEEEVKT